MPARKRYPRVPLKIQAPCTGDNGYSGTGGQLHLLDTDVPPHELSTIARPIHYLGSKLRVVDNILVAINTLDPAGGPVCDLFAGSGTVAIAAAQFRDVVAVDIQEYSRVLCEALLRPADIPEKCANELLTSARASQTSQNLAWAVEPLTAHEIRCEAAAATGDAESLCHLLERGSLRALQDNGPPPDPRLAAALRSTSRRMKQVGLESSSASLVVRYFGGVYFSYRQALQLDGVLEAISAQPISMRDTFLAATLSTASEIVNTVGKQFAQPIRPRDRHGAPKRHLIQQILRDRSMPALDTYSTWLLRYRAIPRQRPGHEAARGDYRAALKQLAGRISIVYADPPYTRDHYSRYYHVLETLCYRDNPDISTVRIGGKMHVSRGLYRAERHQSPFCIKSQAPAAFQSLFEAVRELGVPMVLSYSPRADIRGSRPRLLSIDKITSMARDRFTKVSVTSAGRMAHNKLNHSRRNVGSSYEAEVLIVCKP